MSSNTDNKTHIMRKNKSPFRRGEMLTVIIIVIGSLMGYLQITSIEEAEETLEFTSLELGSYSEVQDRILETKGLAAKISESRGPGFSNECAVYQLSDQIHKGLTNETVPIVRSKYLEIFLDTELAYRKSGSKSQAWENLRAEVAETARKNRERWNAQLDDLDARSDLALEQSIEFKITNKIIKIVTTGKYNPEHKMGLVKENMKESIRRARETFDAAARLQD